MTVRAEILAEPQALRRRASVWANWARTARRKPVGLLSLLLILGLLLAALGADVIAPYDPQDTFRQHLMEGPSGQFLLGTDHLGRDILSRIIHGARISLMVGMVSVGIGTLGGTLLGVVSGYFEGKLDLLVQRVMDAQMALPSIVLALAILAAAGPGLFNVMVAIGLANIPGTNRIVRAAVLTEKRNLYVDAARLVGCRELRIVARHILPNVVAPIIVIATVTLAAAILTEATLSFLGVGVPAPDPSWGSMLTRDTRKFMLAQPLMALWPGIAISLAVLGWNLLGDALRDVWDPRLRGG